MNILERILEAKRAEITAAQQMLPQSALETRARAAPATRDFVAAVNTKLASGRPAVIAEMKRASPSRGALRPDFDPAAIAKSFAAAGAACLSVLTDHQFFQGTIDHLEAAREACSLPVLRKDFIVEPYQVYECRAIGADCILLIAACLSREELNSLEGLALRLDMAVLVEVHNASELDSALSLKTPLIGINNRDLRTFETKLETTLGLLSRVPKNRIVITESGILSPADVGRMRAQGVNAFLVGEAFMRAPDPGGALRALFENA